MVLHQAVTAVVAQLKRARRLGVEAPGSGQYRSDLIAGRGAARGLIEQAEFWGASPRSRAGTASN